jgi:hypothetical protein
MCQNAGWERYSSKENSNRLAESSPGYKHLPNRDRRHRLGRMSEPQLPTGISAGRERVYGSLINLRLLIVVEALRFGQTNLIEQV